MKFELRPQYPDWKGNDRKALHVDEEGLLAIHNGDLSQLPVDVLEELKRPMYQGPFTLSGMTVFYDL